MPQYLITYLGTPNISSPEEKQAHMEEYKTWLSSLGDAAVSPANPLKSTRTVHPDGTVSSGGKSTISGYTIISADSDDEALAIAKACPFINVGGSLELSELIKMPF